MIGDHERQDDPEWIAMSFQVTVATARPKD
jgi:hypothetical protein